MKKLKQLIEDKDFAQAKAYILDNRERLEEIADCLLEEIEGKLSAKSEVRDMFIGIVDECLETDKWRVNGNLSQEEIRNDIHNQTGNLVSVPLDDLFRDAPGYFLATTKPGEEYKEEDNDVEIYSYGKSVEKSKVEHHESKSKDILPSMRDYSNVKACDLTFMLTDLKGNKHKITTCTDSDLSVSYTYKENEPE